MGLTCCWKTHGVFRCSKRWSYRLQHHTGSKVPSPSSRDLSFSSRTSLACSSCHRSSLSRSSLFPSPPAFPLNKLGFPKTRKNKYKHGRHRRRWYARYNKLKFSRKKGHEIMEDEVFLKRIATHFLFHRDLSETFAFHYIVDDIMLFHLLFL